MSEQQQKVSFTQLRLWDQCPARWAIEYRLGWRQPPSKAAVSGSLTHALIASEFGSPEFVDGIDLLSRADIDLAKRRAEAAVGFMEEHGLKPVHAELFAEGTIGELPVMGYIDAVVTDGVKQVAIDWKTGASGDVRQLAFYKRLVPDVDELWFVWLGNPGQVTKTKWEGQEDDWPAKTAGRFRAFLSFQQRTFETQPGAWCKWCPAVSVCPEGGR